MSSSELSLFDLPVEILCKIARHSGTESYYNLILTCSFWKEVMLCNLLYLLRINKGVRQFEEKSGFHAHPEQVLMLRALQKSSDEHSLIRAPMGSGKTAIMMMLALNTPGKSIAVMTTRAYTTWIAELKSFGLKLHQDPNKSDVIVVHTKFPKHRDAILDGKKNPFPDKKVLITTSYYLASHYRRDRLTSWASGKSFEYVPEGSIIVDEAHLYLNNKSKGRIVHQVMEIPNTRKYWFSASPMSTCYFGNFGRQPFQYKVRSQNTAGYPKLIVRRKFRKDKIIQTIENYSGDRDHVAVFCNAPLKNLRALAKKIKVDKKVMVFSNTAPTILDRWKKKGGILLCNYLTSAEGTNLPETERALFFHFEEVSLEKARQVVGRIRRKNSVCKEIDVFFFETSNKIGLVRSRINEIYGCSLEMTGFSKKSQERMRAILEHLSSDGYSVKKLSNSDLLHLFTFEHESPLPVNLTKLTIPLEKILSYGSL